MTNHEHEQKKIMADQNIVVFFLFLLIVIIYIIIEEEQTEIDAFLSLLVREKIVKVRDFMELTVPNMFCQSYRRYFRMFPPTVNRLVQIVNTCPRMHRRINRRSIPLHKKVHMTLVYLGSQTTIFGLAQLFGVSEEAFIRATDDVMLSLIDNIDQFIYWPEKRDYAHIANNFDHIGRFFPNVIGCLDGCHLRIQVGARVRHFYLNYKQYTSINLMAIVTHNMSFLDIFVGWPGRSHDSRVFRRSPIYTELTHLMQIPNQLAPETYTILADKAFPLVKEIMTPYRGRPQDLTPGQRKFNRHLNSKRQVVERTFALLKQRFRRLKWLNQRSVERSVNVVMAACILHNFCIIENDNIDYYLTRVLLQLQNANLNGPQMQLVTNYKTRQGNMKRQMLTQIIRRQV